MARQPPVVVVLLITVGVLAIFRIFFTRFVNHEPQASFLCKERAANALGDGVRLRAWGNYRSLNVDKLLNATPFIIFSVGSLACIGTVELAMKTKPKNDSTLGFSKVSIVENWLSKLLAETFVVRARWL